MGTDPESSARGGMNEDGTEREQEASHYAANAVEEKKQRSSQCLSFDDAAEFFIDLIGLAEALFTTLYFDEEKYGFVLVALVFSLAPVADSTLKLMAYFTKPEWDDFLVDLVSEGVQAFLFILFCDFSALSKLWIPIMMGCQVLVMIAMKCKRICRGEALGRSTEQKAMRCATCCVGNCMTVAVGLLTLLTLLMQDESPYLQTPYEVTVAVVYWTFELNMKYAFAAIEEALSGDLLEEMGNEFNEEAKQKLQNFLADPSTKHGKVAKVKDIVMAGNFVYSTVLAWVWWFSPDIRETYDKVIAMGNMVLSCFVVAMACCGVCCVICASAATSDLDEGVANNYGLDSNDGEERTQSPVATPVTETNATPVTETNATPEGRYDIEKLVGLRDALVLIRKELSRKRQEENAGESADVDV